MSKRELFNQKKGKRKIKRDTPDIPQSIDINSIIHEKRS